MGNPDSAFPFPDFETPRLRLRILTLDDTESVYRHFSDDDVTRYMDIDSCTRLEEAREIIAFHLNDTGCRWGLFLKATGLLIGTCGYHGWVQEPPTPTAEIGYDLDTAHWGQGLMNETLQTVIPFGFETMKLTQIRASVEPENHRSLRLLNTLNFRPEPGLRNGLKWFSLSSQDWNEWTAT